MQSSSYPLALHSASLPASRQVLHWGLWPLKQLDGGGVGRIAVGCGVGVVVVGIVVGHGVVVAVEAQSRCGSQAHMSEF